MNRNAMEELLLRFCDKRIICATIENDGQHINLKSGYSEEEFQSFLKELDFQYYSGYGSQKLFGIVWLENGAWATRGEYDGSEWWEFHELPEIPKDLL